MNKQNKFINYFLQFKNRTSILLMSSMVTMTLSSPVTASSKDPLITTRDCVNLKIEQCKTIFEDIKKSYRDMEKQYKSESKSMKPMECRKDYQKNLITLFNNHELRLTKKQQECLEKPIGEVEKDMAQMCYKAVKDRDDRLVKIAAKIAADIFPDALYKSGVPEYLTSAEIENIECEEDANNKLRNIKQILQDK